MTGRTTGWRRWLSTREPPCLSQASPPWSLAFWRSPWHCYSNEMAVLRRAAAPRLLASSVAFGCGRSILKFGRWTLLRLVLGRPRTSEIGEWQACPRQCIRRRRIIFRLS
ncbi:hypothetical protein BQ8482_180486 [Mesorhizobium delmotii]|uniref:Uncharacterized protein n=1 Tax=Mesorhizobium delmotii TaxID=1631247 RepID=A0A2P9AJE8_9HYPH|nr:hypothetical protein BQ8482_180486 [Mesorhizobium delmotii]